MPKDIFPSIDIPVINVVWTYTGTRPSEMEGQITTFSEYAVSECGSATCSASSRRRCPASR